MAARARGRSRRGLRTLAAVLPRPGGKHNSLHEALTPPRPGVDGSDGSHNSPTEIATASIGRTSRLRTLRRRASAVAQPSVCSYPRSRTARKEGGVTRAEVAKTLAKVATPCDPRASSPRHSGHMRTFPVGRRLEMSVYAWIRPTTERTHVPTAVPTERAAPPLHRRPAGGRMPLALSPSATGSSPRPRARP
jgi:hypothetical protein